MTLSISDWFGFTSNYYQNKLHLTDSGLISLFRRVHAPYSITTDIIIKYNKKNNVFY